MLGTTNDREWQRLALQMLERPDLAADPRFATNIMRCNEREVIDEAISAWTRQHPLAEIQSVADAAGIGVIQAVREAGPNICTFGVFTDITSTAPDNILGTYLADYAQGVERIVAGIKNGSPLPASNVVFGLKDADVMKFTYNDKARRAVPEDVRQYVDAVKAKIISGEIHTLGG